MAESKLELLGRRVEVMNARPGWDTEPPASGWLQRWAGGEAREGEGDATRPVCTAPLPHSLMQKRAQTSGVHFQRLCALYSMLRRASLCNAKP